MGDDIDVQMRRPPRVLEVSGRRSVPELGNRNVRKRASEEQHRLGSQEQTVVP
jgi:hypothetical protein